MTKRRSFEYVTRTAKNAAGLGVRQTLQFEYFNPNGACTAKRKMDDLVSEVVESGLAKNGALFIHGSLNHFHDDKLRALINMKRPRGWPVRYHVQCLRNEIEAARFFVEEKRAAAQAPNTQIEVTL